MTEITHEKSTIEKLWDRRFFQYLATYLGVCWGLIQFSEWIVNRYGFDSSWIDKIVLFLFALLPAMASFIYFHGRPGHDPWRPFEKILYPINLILALGASLFLIEGNAQTTREIKIENETGDTVLREVPKMEFTKRIVFFPLESSLPEEDEWKKIAIPVLTDLDLEQDMEWVSTRPTSLKEECEDYGYNYLEEVPFSVKIKVAKDIYKDYIGTGSIKEENGNVVVDYQVIRVRDGKAVYNNTLSGESIFSVADQISEATRSKVDDRIETNSTFLDLPTSELISSNQDAMESFIKAQLKYNEGKSGYAPALQMITEATEKDPNCAECFITKAKYESTLGIDATASVQKALDLSDNLPERQKLDIKFLYYAMNRDMQKSQKLLQFWKELYPQDVSPFSKLTSLLSTSINFKEAYDVAQEAINKGHKGSMLLTAADLAIKNNDIEAAEKYVEEYKSRYPEKAAQKSILGEIYVAKGDYENAIKIYERNTIVNPNNFSVATKLADAYINNLEFQKGLKLYEDALGTAKNFRDSIEIYQSFTGITWPYGMVDIWEEAYEKSKKLHFSNYPPMSYLQSIFTAGGVYAEIGDFKKVKEIEKEVMEISPPQAKPIIQTLVNYLSVLWRDDKENFEAAWKEAEPIIVSSSGETGRLNGELFTSYFTDDWEGTIAAFEKFQDISGSFIGSAAPIIAKAYNNLGRETEGIEKVDDFLKTSPNNPNLLYPKFDMLVHAKQYTEAAKMIPKLDKVFSLTHPKWSAKIEYEKLKAEVENQNG